MVERCDDFRTDSIRQLRRRNALRRNRLAHDDLHDAATNMIRLGHKDRARAANRNRHDLRFRLRCKHEAAAFESMDHTITARAAFRKNDDRRAMPDGVGRFPQGFDRGMRILSIYRYVTRASQMPAEKRIA